MCSSTKAVPQRILLATKSAILRNTRKTILSNFGYYVVAPTNDHDALVLIQTQSFGLLILGNTLEPESMVKLADEFRRCQPGGRVLEILLAPGVGTLREPDATVVGVDGPVALQKMIEEQIGKTGTR